MRVVVNVLEVNRVRFVALEGITLALAEAIDAGERSGRHDEHGILESARELRRALSTLLAQPLPEVKMDATTALEVELLAPAHELEQLADELEQLGRSGRFDGPETDPVAARLAGIIGELRQRVASRS